MRKARAVAKLRRKAGATVFAVGLLAGGILAVGAAAPASAAPLPCTSDMYFVATRTATLVDRAPDGTLTTLASGIPYSSIALNPIDGNLYGLTNGVGIVPHLYRVAADGTPTDLGLIGGLPTGSYSSATFDGAGNLWTGDVGGLYKIDVTTVTGTLALPGARFSGDMVLIDGFFYGFGNTSLNRVDAATGATTTLPGIKTADLPPNPFGGSNVGPGSAATWTFDGHLYASFGNRVFDIVGFSGANPYAVLVTTLPGVAAVGDGASCSAAANPFLHAGDDSFIADPVSPASGGTAGNVYTNDTLNAAPFAATAVAATVASDGGLIGAAIGADGSLTVPPNTPPGTYTVSYQICSAGHATLCDTATAAVLIGTAGAAGPPASPTPVAGGAELAASGSDGIGTSGLAAALLAAGGIVIAAVSVVRRRKAPPVRADGD